MPKVANSKLAAFSVPLASFGKGAGASTSPGATAPTVLLSEGGGDGAAAAASSSQCRQQQHSAAGASPPLGASLSHNRVRHIMRSSPDSMNVAADALACMAAAAEAFVQLLARDTYDSAAASATPAANEEVPIDYDTLARCAHERDTYEFLQEIIPRRMSWAEVKRIIGDGDTS